MKPSTSLRKPPGPETEQSKTSPENAGRTDAAFRREVFQDPPRAPFVQPLLALALMAVAAGALAFALPAGLAVRLVTAAAAAALAAAAAVTLAERLRRRTCSLLVKEQTALECWMLERTAMLEDAREAALEASRFKTNLVGSVSHEVRTLLTGIIGMTDLVLETPLTAQQREMLDTARASADTLLAVANDLLDISRIENGTIGFKKVGFPLRESVDVTMRALLVPARNKGLELSWHMGAEVPDRLIGDPDRLRQVLVNLVTNAIKLTSVGRVSLRINEESRTAGEVWLHFAVADTGPGYTDKRSASSGTGLGLAICGRLVALMGGRLWPSPGPGGQGSVFHFTACFKLEGTPAASATAADRAAIDRSGAFKTP